MNRGYALIGLVALSAVVGCGPQEMPGGEQTGVQETTPASESEKHYTIGVVPKGLGNQFWVTVKAGAEVAGNELGATIVWNGPAKEVEVTKQINIIEDMISRAVDAIVMAACHEEALVGVIRKAVDQGIPVVTIDSGVKSDLPISFVATDNIAGAKAAAHTLARLIDGQGEVGLVPIIPGAATSEMRESGFIEGISEYPDIKLVSKLYSYAAVDKAMAVVQDMMTSHPDMKGVFAASEQGAIGAARAIEAAGKAGHIKLVGFDASEDQVAALEKGTIDALIVQNPFAMGREGVRTAINYLQGREVQKRIDTGVTVVTKDNVADPEIQKLLNPMS